MLVLAKDVTWYDERFRGPFGARTAQALDMSQHLTFEVNPLDFAVHIPFAEPEHVRMSADAVYDQVSACFGILVASQLSTHFGLISIGTFAACRIRVPICDRSRLRVEDWMHRQQTLLGRLWGVLLDRQAPQLGLLQEPFQDSGK